jgi:hypothetical protein
MTPSYRYRAVGFVIGFAVGASILATTGIRYLPIPVAIIGWFVGRHFDRRRIAQLIRNDQEQ